MNAFYPQPYSHTVTHRLHARLIDEKETQMQCVPCSNDTVKVTKDRQKLHAGVSQSGLKQTSLHAPLQPRFEVNMPRMLLRFSNCLFGFLAHSLSVWARFLKHTSNGRLTSEAVCQLNFKNTLASL